MKGEQLYREIGEADDKYIKSAEKSFERAKNKEKREKTTHLTTAYAFVRKSADPCATPHPLFEMRHGQVF